MGIETLLLLLNGDFISNVYSAKDLVVGWPKFPMGINFQGLSITGTMVLHVCDAGVSLVFYSFIESHQPAQ